MATSLEIPPVQYGQFSLEEKNRLALEKAATDHQISIELLYRLSGGFSGADLFLAKIETTNNSSSELVIIKIDRFNKSKNEADRYTAAVNSFSEKFRTQHFVGMPFSPVISTKKDRSVLFYNIAGHSLIEFRPLRQYSQASTISLIATGVAKDLLSEWSIKKIYHDRFYGFEIVQRFFENRYTLRNNSIRSFLEEDLKLSSMEGIIIGDAVLPNPYLLLSAVAPLKNERKIFLPSSSCHGDLNSGNVLLSNPRLPSSEPSYFFDRLPSLPERWLLSI